VDDWQSDDVPAPLASAPGPDYPHGQCTEFAARLTRERTGSTAFYFPRNPGDPPRDAKVWDALCRSTGTCAVETKPRVNSVAQFKSGVFAKWGHVAVVTAVHADGTFDVIESNYPKALTVGTRSHVDPATVATFLYPTPT
jgi:surface antigen